MPGWFCLTASCKGAVALVNQKGAPGKSRAWVKHLDQMKGGSDNSKQLIRLGLRLCVIHPTPPESCTAPAFFTHEVDVVRKTIRLQEAHHLSTSIIENNSFMH